MNEDWKGLNLPQLIDLLEPVPQPDAVSMLPQTTGWIWLGLFVLIGIGIAVWRAIRWRKRTAYRRAALKELDAYSEDPAQLASLIRRTALSAYPRTEIASLHGNDWLSFLDSTYDGGAFLNGPGKCLADGPYHGESSAPGVKDAVRIWIKTHRREAA